MAFVNLVGLLLSPFKLFFDFLRYSASFSFHFPPFQSKNLPNPTSRISNRSLAS